MSSTEAKEKSWIWSPSLIVYDTGACTKEEHDPVKAVLYHRPRTAPMNIRTAICGQVAGVIHFCRGAFGSPNTIKTKSAVISLKHYGRFVLMVTGDSKELVEGRLTTVSRLLDAATGGIQLLWRENYQDQSIFVQKLSSLLDSIVFHALPGINFEDGIFASSSVSTSLSSGISPSSDVLEDLESERTIHEEVGTSSLGLWRRKRQPDSDAKSEASQCKMEANLTPVVGDERKTSEDAIMTSLHQEFDAVPSVSLPKSGGFAFLKAQQLLELCQQNSGVLAGSTSYRNRVLNSQIEPELGVVLMSLNGSDCESNEILQKKPSSFELPPGVALFDFNLSQRNLSNVINSIPKIFVKTRGRKSIHDEAPSKNLTILRSSLHNQSLHSYTSSIPPKLNINSCSESTTALNYIQNNKQIDPLLLCAKINHNQSILAEGRPSRSLPGSPRKIRVPTMLPDVGSDSPKLRYKVLTALKPKSGPSSHNTPRKIPPNKYGRVNEGQNNGIPHRGNNLSAPSLKRNEANSRAEKTTKSSAFIDSQQDLDIIHSLIPKERSDTMDISIKNTKNKLNLHFAPDKVNRPCDDSETEVKISREINGNLSKDHIKKEFHTKSHFIDINDEDETSKSEESEISVLELGSLLESKENGNKMFAEATRPDSPKSDLSSANEDESNYIAGPGDSEVRSSNLITNVEENQWTKVVLYRQKISNMLLFLFLNNKAASNQELIYDLSYLATSALPEIEANLVKIWEMSEEREGETFLRKSYSVLSAVDLASLHIPLVVEAHRDFGKYKSLSEITLRADDKVIWGHRNGKSETYYQSTGILRTGLPIPSDVMARIPNRARRRLERDHGITIL